MWCPVTENSLIQGYTRLGTSLPEKVKNRHGKDMKVYVAG